MRQPNLRSSCKSGLLTRPEKQRKETGQEARPTEKGSVKICAMAMKTPTGLAAVLDRADTAVR